MRSLLAPRAIAVLGASDDARKLSGRPVDYLRRFGYRGAILPINPRRDTVQGLPAYRSIEEAPGEIDLAMIVLGAEKVPDAVRSCAARGVRAVIVSAAGFAEAGARGVDLQEQLRRVVDDTGIRVLGPNCLGLMNLTTRAVPTFTSALDEDVPLTRGPLAFVSQSGAFGSFVFSAAQQAGLGFSHFVNTGNEVDLTVPDVLDALLDEDGVGVLLAYLEGVNDGPALLRAASHAHAAGTPIVMVKVGRSESGARAARSHTASLAGEDAVFGDLVREHGVTRVSGVESMLDAAQVFATGRRTGGRRLTIVTASGGAGVLMADAAEAGGLAVADWDVSWQATMSAVIPEYGSARNPIDLTGTLVADPDLLRRALEVVAEHPQTDMVAVLLGNSDGCANDLVAAIEDAEKASDRPIVVVWTGGNGRARTRLTASGVPCFTDPGRAAGALSRLADFSLRPALAVPERPHDVAEATARALIGRARDAGATQLDELDSLGLLAAYGIAGAPSRAAADPREAITAFEELGGPVAVKLLSNRVAHKTEIGGVRLGLTESSEVGVAADELLRLEPDARVLVQRWCTGTELIVGAKHDAAFGPVVVVGLGGVLVEVLGDSRAAAAPVDRPGAERMLQGLRGAALLGPARGRPGRDVPAVVDTIVRVSWLFADLADELSELDVNPVMADAAGSGAVAADCLAVLTPVEQR